MRYLFALLAGSLFGLGLLVAGMTDTAKVQGFLDVFGAWDPTLMFVLGGAIIPMAIAWPLAERRRTAFTGTRIPAQGDALIDLRLISGSALFGLGWGLVGLCPGPALAVAGFGGWQALVFLAALIAGMILARRTRLAAPLPGQAGSPCDVAGMTPAESGTGPIPDTVLSDI
ncbi:DUF6691 family protein [Frigidibacter sp. ROC022]|uniref:DUF6691 family protein n=1 Tax=Frigidibacter sp. ROC022 TaxID=2971796 RepID=UPI003083D985